jgi:hypothetical protein
MSSLYELTGQRLDLQRKLETLNIDEETLLDTLEGESTELEAKIADYGFVIRNMETFGEAIKVEETRLAQRRKAQEAKVEHIKSWLLQNMERCGISKIEHPAFTISVKSNPAKVVVDKEGDIPQEYFKQVIVEPTWQLVKKDVADAIKAGKNVAGAHLEQSKRIEIK